MHGSLDPVVVVASEAVRGRGACGGRFWTLDPIDGTKGLHDVSPLRFNFAGAAGENPRHSLVVQSLIRVSVTVGVRARERVWISRTR
jgi:hypothetical protein